MNLNLKKSTWVNCLCLEGAHPLLKKKGMALQVRGERVRTFLSLVAHADGDMIMVGACNTVDVTVECQVHVGG